MNNNTSDIMVSLFGSTSYPGLLRLLLSEALGESSSQRDLIGQCEYNEGIESYSLTG
jgi:hypothetical protein